MNEEMKQVQDASQTIVTNKGEIEMNVTFRKSLKPAVVEEIKKAIEYATKHSNPPNQLLFEAFAGTPDGQKIIAAWRHIAERGFLLSDLNVPAICGTKKQRYFAEKIVKHRMPNRLYGMRQDRDSLLGIISEHNWKNLIHRKPSQVLTYATKHGFRKEALQHAFQHGDGTMTWAFDHLWEADMLSTNDLIRAYHCFFWRKIESKKHTREEIGWTILNSGKTRNNDYLFKEIFENAGELTTLKAQALDILAEDIENWSGIARLRGLVLLLEHAQPENRCKFWNLLKEEFQTTTHWRTATIGIGSMPKLNQILSDAKKLGVTSDQELDELVSDLYGQIRNIPDQELVCTFLETTASISSRLTDELFGFLAKEAAAIINGYQAHINMHELKGQKKDFIEKVVSINGSAAWDKKAYAFLREFASSLPGRYAESTWSSVLNYMLACNYLKSMTTAAMTEIIEKHPETTNLMRMVEFMDYFNPTEEQLILIRKAADIMLSNPKTSASDRANILSFFPEPRIGGDAQETQLDHAA